MTSPLALPGWRHIYSGKVRDLYVPADLPADARAERMLVVASDRVSAFDHVLEPGIPDKGVLLTTLSLWWFDRLATGGGRRARHPESSALRPRARRATGLRELIPAEVEGRAMVVKGLTMQPIECVVRGYLTGSGWAEYQAERHGVRHPASGRARTTATGCPSPSTRRRSRRRWASTTRTSRSSARSSSSAPSAPRELRDLSLEIYARAARIAEARGLILADTKFEFGLDDAGVMTLADEVLTSDSSRYWDAAAWQTGTTPAERMASFDKQIVRDWLAANWDKTGTPPELPAEIVEQTADRYRELLARLTS